MSQCLIVDDMAVIRKAIKSILEKFGFETIKEAENGLDALNQCKEYMPDIILLDWNMPVMNGLDFLLSLRQEKDGDIPQVILCTTENEIEKVKLAMESGANEYIMKPFDENTIKDKFVILGIMDD